MLINLNKEPLVGALEWGDGFHSENVVQRQPSWSCFLGGSAALDDDEDPRVSGSLVGTVAARVCVTLSGREEQQKIVVFSFASENEACFFVRMR